jgi:hypothetical protein
MKNGVSLDFRSMLDGSMDKPDASCILSPTFSVARNTLLVIHGKQTINYFKTTILGIKEIAP